MSGRIIKQVRRQDYYRHLLAALREFGIGEYSIEPPTGRGHPMLKFSVGEQTHRIPLPGSPSSGSRAQDYLRTEIRRRARRSMLAG